MQGYFFVCIFCVCVGAWDNTSRWELKVKDCQNHEVTHKPLSEQREIYPMKMILHWFSHSPFVYPHLFSLFLSPALLSSSLLQRLLMRSGRQLPSRQRTSRSISTCIEFLHPVINSYWLLAMWDILLEHLNFEKLISVGQRSVLRDVLHMVRLQCWSVSCHALITWRQGRGWCVAWRII